MLLLFITVLTLPISERDARIVTIIPFTTVAVDPDDDFSGCMCALFILNRSIRKKKEGYGTVGDSPLLTIIHTIIHTIILSYLLLSYY